jgi:hypothetical protein
LANKIAAIEQGSIRERAGNEQGVKQRDIVQLRWPKEPRMDWHSTLAGIEFLGGSTIEDLQASCDAIPETAGVYVLKRLSPRPVVFLAVNPGGHLKGRDSTVSISRLKERWIPSADVVYIGKAGGNDQGATLRSRIRSFMQFGLGKPCSHWGGRCIWQLADAKALRVYWAVTHDEEPTMAESRLIDAFRQSHGRLPFANLRR